jgi:uncharacterized membrane protein
MLTIFDFPRMSLAARASLVVWVLTMLSMPVIGWTLGTDTMRRSMSAGVLVQVLAVLIILYDAWGIRRLLFTFGIVAGLAYCAELLGSSTGIPFGKYYYTGLLQPQLAGVPLLIPLAWMMMLPPAWATGYLITQRSGRSLMFIAVSALAFTAWDLFLDPQMVAWDFWRWQEPGIYFGIPLSNYAGWVIVSAGLSLIANPRDLPAGPLFLVYALTWMLQTIGQGIFWGQPGPALFGFLGAGLFILLVFVLNRRGYATT